MNVMITGAAGFVGAFLTKYGLDAGARVLGIDIKEPASGMQDAAFEICDVRDQERVSSLVRAFRPHCIFHLAAQSYPTVSLDRPYETMEVNAGGTISVFEAVRLLEKKAMVVVACSSAEYGPVASSDLPVREDHPLRPLHPYGVSKVAQDLLAAQYFVNYRQPTVRIRIFNTTGPAKIGDVCSDLTKRVVEIESRSGMGSLRVGNLTTQRAILDVRDLVRALWLSVDLCEPGEVYNVGADAIYSIQELIAEIRRQSGVPFELEQDPKLMRRCDEPVIAGDVTRFRERTGWRQEIPLEMTIGEMLEWWRLQAVGVADGPAEKKAVTRGSTELHSDACN